VKDELTIESHLWADKNSRELSIDGRLLILKSLYPGADASSHANRICAPQKLSASHAASASRRYS
jgi:hypothetical protein